MKWILFAVFLFITFPTFAQTKFVFHSNWFFRYDRQDFPDTRDSVNRLRLRIRPLLSFLPAPSWEISGEGEGNWIDESDEPTPLPGFTAPQFHTPLFDRDNFRRNKIVLSRLFVKYVPSPQLELVGGKFENPFLTTELVWDRDLHPNGAVISKSFSWTSHPSLLFTARGGDFFATHYLHDRSNVLAFQTVLQADTGRSRLTFGASYYDHDVNDVAVQLLRTNTHVGNIVPNDYNILDFIARARINFRFPVTMQIDFADNLSADEFTPGSAGNGGRGYLAEILVGKLQDRYDWRVRYAHHHVESDAIFAAYNTDDWWFPTRGEGDRIQLSLMITQWLVADASYLTQHLIGQDPDFKRWQFTAEINWP